MSDVVVIDEEAVKLIMAAIEGVGQVYSVVRCRQHPTHILAGSHRVEAMKRLKIEPRYFDLDVDKRAKEMGVSHDVAEHLIRINANTQREVGESERAREFLTLAKTFESEGVPKPQIAAKVVQSLKKRFSASYVFQLLPPEYKDPEKASSGKKGGESQKKSAQLSGAQLMVEPKKVVALPEADVVSDMRKLAAQKVDVPEVKEDESPKAIIEKLKLEDVRPNMCFEGPLGVFWPIADVSLETLQESKKALEAEIRRRG